MLDLQLHVQSVHITTKIVSWNPAHEEVYSIQHSACSQVFLSGGTCTLLLHFWGYIQIFGGAMYPLTLHLGVQRKLTAFSPRKVVHSVFCILRVIDTGLSLL